METECKGQHIKWLHEMLRELPCLSKEKECKINIVQREDGWRTTEDTWMEIGEAEEEVFFINVLGVEEVDSEEELKAEIVKTEAAIDDCFIRRAIRVGIEVDVVEGRSMSEEERDLLSKKLGDGIGVQSKRRREIEE
jgi:hypothetical protein